MRRALVMLLMAGLLACDTPRSGSAWFPLERGHEWTYSVRTELETQAVTRETLTLRNLGSETLAGKPAWRRHSSSGVDYWHRQDDTGVYRVASKSELDAEARPDAERRYVLKEPLAVGTSWQASTTAYLLRRRSEFPRELRHTHPSLPMTYTIEALAQKVQTPAATFDGCLRVRGEARVRVYADAAAGWRDLPLTTLEWYCPGVGLVRLQRDEPARSAFLDGGSLTLELQSWR
jgi:hypothetical protein